MKQVRNIMALAIALTACGALADSTDLDNKLRLDYRQTEREVVKMWIAGDSGRKLDSKVAELVSLKSRMDTRDVNPGPSLLGDALAKNPGLTKPKDMARAMVLEHFRRKGVNLENEVFVDGKYWIKRRGGAPN